MSFPFYEDRFKPLLRQAQCRAHACNAAADHQGAFVDGIRLAVRGLSKAALATAILTRSLALSVQKQDPRCEPRSPGS